MPVMVPTQDLPERKRPNGRAGRGGVRCPSQTRLFFVLCHPCAPVLRPAPRPLHMKGAEGGKTPAEKVPRLGQASILYSKKPKSCLLSVHWALLASTCIGFLISQRDWSIGPTDRAIKVKRRMPLAERVLNSAH